SRHLSGRAPGEPPPTLIDYLPRNALAFIDESHVTIPQVGGMYRGDRARKENLVNYGFRLPSALDNRPLRFDEFEKLLPQTIFVSATPADYEHKHAGQVVEQLVRPTGLVDPVLEVRPAQTQVVDTDHRPCRASHQWHGHPVRRQDDGFHDGCDRRDNAPAKQAACLEPEDGHYADRRDQANQGHYRWRLRYRPGAKTAQGRAGA